MSFSNKMFSEDRHNLRHDLRHECELNVHEDVTYRYIDHGCFVKSRRIFRKWMLIDEYNPRSRSFYKSSFIIKREKIFHLNFYYYVIHPFSAFRELWEFFQVIIILLQILATPLKLLLHSDIPSMVEYAMDSLALMDICLAFNTGFVNNQANRVNLNRKAIAKHYLTTRFICDLLSFVDVRLIGLLRYGMLEYDLVNTSKYLVFINVAKWFRFSVLWIYLNRLKESRQINMFAMSIFKLTITFTLLILWMSALTFVSSFNPHDLDTEQRKLIESVRRSFNMLFQIGSVVAPDDLGVLISQMVCLLCGFILSILILCQMMQSGTKYNASRKYNQSVKQLNDYMRHKALPPALQAKILKYYDFRYEMSYYQEDHIMSILGPQLVQEIMLQAHMHFFAKFPLFEIVPLHVLFGVIMKMKVICYMPSDVIVGAGFKNMSMYFINYGSVAIYSLSGKELKHLAEGQHFGELSLMGDTKYNSDTIIAIDCCELYVLKRKSFISAIEAYPDVFIKVKHYMKHYIAKHYHEEENAYEELVIPRQSSK